MADGDALWLALHDFEGRVFKEFVSELEVALDRVLASGWPADRIERHCRGRIDDRFRESIILKRGTGLDADLAVFEVWIAFEMEPGVVTVDRRWLVENLPPPPA